MYRLFKNAREPMSSYTHFLGIIFSTAATIFLVLLNTINGDFQYECWYPFWSLDSPCLRYTVQVPSIIFTMALCLSRSGSANWTTQ